MNYSKPLDTFRLDKNEVFKLIDVLISRKTSIPPEVLTAYKENIYEAIKRVETDVISNVKDSIELKNKALKFIEAAKNGNIFNSDEYIMEHIPVVVPFNAACLLVFVHGLIIYAFLRLIDDISRNGLEGLHDIMSLIMGNTADSTTSVLDDLELPTSYKKEDLN